MPRGKHGEAAAVRHEVQHLELEVSAYKRTTERLSETNQRLVDAAEERRQYWAARERELLDMVEHAAAPQIERLQVDLTRQAKLRREAEDAAKVSAAERQKIIDRFMEWLMEGDGLDYESALRVIGGALGMTVVGSIEMRARHKGSDEETAAIAARVDRAREKKNSQSRAHGLRITPDVAR